MCYVKRELKVTVIRLLKTAFLVIGMIMILINTTHAEIININNQGLIDLLKRNVTIIDIRTETEWRQTGVIPGSHLLTLFDEQRQVVNPDGWLEKVKGLVPLDKPVIIVCRTGNRTVPATKFLIRSGYREVYNVSSGIEPWIKAGLPMTKF